MPITGLSLAENTPFRSSYDNAPEDQQTVFILGAVDVLVRSSIQDNAQSWESAEGGMRLVNKTAYRNIELVRFGLKGFEKFKDEKNNDIVFKTIDRVVGGKLYKVLSDDIVFKIPPEVLQELAEEILHINTGGVELRKKSMTP